MSFAVPENDLADLQLGAGESRLALGGKYMLLTNSGTYDQASNVCRASSVDEFDIDLWQTSNLFKLGYRICWKVSSSNFPSFERNLNTTSPPGMGSETRVFHRTSYHDFDRP